jgi:hypothetical protein
MIDLLGLPRNTFPVGGVVLGYVNKEASQKPRMPIESLRHEEKYHPETLRPAIDAYDRTLQEYWQKIGRADGLTWSANMAQHCSTFSSRGSRNSKASTARLYDRGVAVCVVPVQAQTD